MSEELKRLVTHLTHFPGIGRRTAERIAFYLLKMDEATVKDFIASILHFRKRTRVCPICFNITDKEPCKICNDPKRDKDVICVVEEVSDFFAIEKANSYQGLYHILGGVLTAAPTQKNLRVKELIDRVKGNNIKEVIIATNPTTEGELTANYLAKILKPLVGKVSRIARGLPFGSSIGLADIATIAQAIEARKEI